MIEFLKNSTLAVVIAAIGAVAGYFNGGAAAKENTVTRTDEKIGVVQTFAAKVKTDNELVNAVQDTKIETITKDMAEIKSDVKQILRTLRPDDFRPAVEEVLNAPLVRGVDKTGAPINAKRNE